jgi:transposase
MICATIWILEITLYEVQIMDFLSGANRSQMRMMFSLDSLIEKDNPVRIIDALVRALDLGKMGFSKTAPAREGRPGYDPRDMAALYIYGNLHKVRSSRLLERERRVNIELKWLMRELAPDFKTIADFRRDNPEALKNTFKEFGRIMREAARRNSTQ